MQGCDDTCDSEPQSTLNKLKPVLITVAMMRRGGMVLFERIAVQ